MRINCSVSPFPIPFHTYVQALRYESFEKIKEGLHLQLVEFYEQGIEATEDAPAENLDDNVGEEGAGSGTEDAAEAEQRRPHTDRVGGSSKTLALRRIKSCPGAIVNATARKENMVTAVTDFRCTCRCSFDLEFLYECLFFTTGIHPAASAVSLKTTDSSPAARDATGGRNSGRASAASATANGWCWLDYAGGGSDLCDFLIDRCSQQFRLANYFYW